MDTFFEQIIAIRKTGKTILAVTGIWVLALVLAVVLFSLSTVIPAFSTILLVAVCLVFFGAYKLSKKFSIEYEYIITNGCFDVDKIIARSSRKRMMTFEISNVESIEKYNPHSVQNRKFASVLIACNPDDAGAYSLIVSEEGKGTRLLVFTPDERMKSAVIKFLPKYIANSAFK